MIRFLRITMALALTLSSMPAWASLEQEVDVKMQQRYQKTWNGGPSARPLEYGEIPNGLILERYRLEFQNDKYMVDVDANNVGKNNQSFAFEGGRPGLMTWKLGWDEMPHLFATDARSPYFYQGNGQMRLPGAWRNTTVTVPNYTVTDPTSATQTTNNNIFNNNVIAALQNTPYVPLGFDVHTADTELRFHPAQDSTVAIGAWRQTKQGTKPQTAAFGFSNSIELAAPIDWETNEAFLDLETGGKDYQLAFNYRLSDFHNKIPNLYWDNPKRLSDQYTNNGYSQGDQSSSGALANAPSNKAHALKIEGGVNLPMNSRLSGEAGYQLWHAVNPMLPFTTNTKITNDAAVNPFNATIQIPTYRAPFDASSMANRPDPNVEGKIEVFTYMGKLTSRPLSWLRGTLSHEAYIMENKSHQYDLVGWGDYDQGWHGETARTPREQFRDDKSILALDYDFASWLSGGTDLKYIAKKQTREIPRIREYEAEQGFTIRPSRELYVNLSYLLGLRRGRSMDLSGYPKETSINSGVTYFTEHPGMRRIDVADRNRNQGRIQAMWTPGEAQYSLSARLTEDKYRLGKGSPTGDRPEVYPDLFGITDDRTAAVGADVSVPIVAGLTADAYYEFDHSRRRLRSSQTACSGVSTTGYNLPAEGAFDCTNPAAPAAIDASPTIMTGNPLSQWGVRMTDRSHIAGLSLTWQASEKLKTVFGYDLVSTLQNYDVLYAGALASTATDRYNGFPTSKRLTQTFRTHTEYKLLKDLTLAANYMYEKFDATDWGYNSDATALRHQNDAIWLGNNPIRNYYAHTVSAGLNYKF